MRVRLISRVSTRPFGKYLTTYVSRYTRRPTRTIRERVTARVLRRSYRRFQCRLRCHWGAAFAATVAISFEFAVVFASAGITKPKVSNANAIPRILFIFIPLFVLKNYGRAFPLFYWREPDLLSKTRKPRAWLHYFSASAASISFIAGSLTNTFA